VKEKDEAVAAVEAARSERTRWDKDKEARCENRETRERNRHDMPFRDPRKSVLQKLRASNVDPDDPTSVIHPALPIAFFAKTCQSAEDGMEPVAGASAGAQTCLTPRDVQETPNKGVAVVLASNKSRYEGDWHQMRDPGDEVLRLAFDSAFTGAASRTVSMSAADS
jgi:hypothetical protein